MLKDADIRDPLFDFLDENYGKIRIIEEKTMGKSRADVVMISEDALFGLEIKSDADSYARLKRQVKDYDKYFDYNFAVVGASHALHIREHIPDYWGIITVEEINGCPDLYIYRIPKANPKVNLKLQMKILWRNELAALQAFFKMPKYTNKSKDFIISKIVERTLLEDNHKSKIDLKTLKPLISAQLMERDYTLLGQN